MPKLLRHRRNVAASSTESPLTSEAGAYSSINRRTTAFVKSQNRSGGRLLSRQRGSIGVRARAADFEFSPANGRAGALSFLALARETLGKVTAEVDPSAVAYLAGVIKRLSAGKPPESPAASTADPRESAEAMTNDPLAAARARGRRHALEQYESADNLALLEARDYAGRNERAINELRQSGELYALLPPNKTRGFRYPKWQFDSDAARLAAALQPFVHAQANCWVIHSFMMGTRDLLGGKSPADVILDDRLDLQSVIDLANSDLSGEQGAR